MAWTDLLLGPFYTQVQVQGAPDSVTKIKTKHSKQGTEVQTWDPGTLEVEAGKL